MSKNTHQRVIQCTNCLTIIHVTVKNGAMQNEVARKVINAGWDINPIRCPNCLK